MPIPGAADIGLRLQARCSRTYATAGGRDACVLLHGRRRRRADRGAARHGRGLPARVIPVEVHHVASIGLDLWLAALAWGASQVVVAGRPPKTPRLREALARPDGLGDTILQALGYQGRHFALSSGDDRAALDATLWTARPALGVRAPATFPVDQRQAHDALDFAIEHLRAARAGAAAAYPAAGGRAVRGDRRRSGGLHDVPRLRRQLSGGRAPRQRRGAAAALHRAQLRAVRPLREDLSGGRDHAGPAACLDARGARSPGC